MAEFNEELITTDTQPQAPSSKRMKRTIDSFFVSTSQKMVQEETLLSTDFLESVNLSSQNTIDCSISEECCDVDAISDFTINSQWPDVWSSDIWMSKKKLYPWLYYRNGHLGCSICKLVSSLSVHKIQGVHIAIEWAEGTVNYYGITRESKLKSLRKKIILHRDSKAHISAQEISQTSELACLERHMDKSNKIELEATQRIFRTAYYLAKNNRPYSDHRDLIELQQINGADLGSSLHSRHTATIIIDHVAFELRRKLFSQVQKIQGKISIIIDESTTISNKSTLIIYLKCETSKIIDPHFIFADLIELEKQDAETIYAALMKSLGKYGFDDCYFNQNLIAFASDGASVMLGKNSGVGTRIAKKYPNTILWHCLNHRLELSVSDAIKRVNAINHFKIFFDKLYSLYSRSPKNQRELSECSSAVCEQVQKIGRLLDTRWVASSYRTVKAVWYSYESLCKHFETASQDLNRDSTDRAMFNGMGKRIQSPEFLIDLGLMFDTLYELSSLSELLQHRGTSIMYADQMIKRTIRRLQSLKINTGTKSLEAECAAKELKFNQTIVLKPNKSIVNINKDKFLSFLITSMEDRLFRVTNADDSNLMKDLQILNKDSWPLEYTPGFGEKEIRNLCKRFVLPEIVTVNAFCDYYDNIGIRIPSDLKPLINCIEVIPCSSSECERGFSQMNLIMDEKRNRLTIEHVNSLLFIQLNGPPLSIWRPLEYCKSWLLHHHSAIDKRGVKTSSQSHEENEVWKYY